MDEPAEIDREPPIGMFRFAQSFFDAGRHLQNACETRELRLPFDSPIYLLYSHALELTMKAFLRTRGIPARRLASREFGHQLRVLWEECVRTGLNTAPNIGAFIGDVIEILDPLATAYEFRYLRVGLKRMPELSEVEKAVSRLMATVKPHL